MHPPPHVALAGHWPVVPGGSHSSSPCVKPSPHCAGQTFTSPPTLLRPSSTRVNRPEKSVRHSGASPPGAMHFCSAFCNPRNALKRHVTVFESPLRNRNPAGLHVPSVLPLRSFL